MNEDYNRNKVIFLDIDGVLATETNRSLFAPKKLWIEKFDRCYPFDPICVEILNEILNETDAEIILSSDWQYYFNLENLGEIFLLNGVLKKPVDITRQVRTRLSLSPISDRVTAINKYLESYSDIEKYIIVDDLPLNDSFNPNIFAWCEDVRLGIAMMGIKNKIILSLNY